MSASSISNEGRRQLVRAGRAPAGNFSPDPSSPETIMTQARQSPVVTVIALDSVRADTLQPYPAWRSRLGFLLG